MRASARWCPLRWRCSAASRSWRIGIAGLSLLGRYLFLPAAMLAIFFGFAALGWMDLPRDVRAAAGSAARWCC